MGDLSKHFSRYEMACKCGCGFDTVDYETLLVAEMVREFVGEPISPSSAARCISHNQAVGGGTNSQHLKGRAIDLPVSEPKKVFEFLCKKFPGRYGIGVYRTFVHIDTRSGEPRRWGISID